MQKECNSILITSLRKEAAIRFRKAPKGTKISGISIPADKNVNEFAPEIISLNEGLSKIGLHISLSRIDSISSILFKEIDVDCPTISFIRDTKTSECIDQSNMTEKHWWIIKSEVMPITEDLSQGVQIGIINPYNTLIKRMAIVFLSSILIMLFIIISFIYQYKLIRILKSILQIREDFSYAMVHDMKTPLSTIFMTLNLLHNGRLDDKPEKKEKFFQIAESETDHLLTLTNKILTISKLEQQKLEMHKEELKLGRVNQRVQHYEIFLKKASLGVRKLSFSLGLALIFFLILAIFPSVTVLMSVPFGIYWRTSLLAFSMAPFCHAQ